MAETRQANITIEAAPDGLHVRIEYTAALDTIPSAIERLKSLGIVDLVESSRPTPTPATNGQKPSRPKGETYFDGDGDECCTLHKRKLNEGRFGSYCGAKARPGDVADKNGYCGLKFG
jgi:hypothetical protein